MTAAFPHGGINAGPSCKGCGRRETECAYRSGCCSRCTHWVGYDVFGNWQSDTPRQEPLIVGNHLKCVPSTRETSVNNRIAPVTEAATSTGATTGTVGEPVAQAWLNALPDRKPACCRAFNRRVSHRQDGLRARHRIEADNPLAPYCCGDDE